MNSPTRPLNCITPPYLLDRLLRSSDSVVREAALSTLVSTARLRGERSVRAGMTVMAAPTSGRRTIFNCGNRTTLGTASRVRGEGDPPVGDSAADMAYDGLGATRRFYAEVLGRDSIDGNGMRLDSYVHYGHAFNNAFWDGAQMVFGDGDGRLFADFTGSLDVIAHELTHGVTEHTAKLEYHVQSGALNESCSDVFGSLVKQWSLGQTADKADWLIGADIFSPGIGGDALRSMKAPGTAFDSPVLGKDPQPDNMSGFVHMPDTEDGDNGGVHINSGIPNKAFYLTAVAIGGSAWEAPGQIWYEALKASTSTTEFQEFADTTFAKAGELFGAGGTEQDAVLDAWRQVGIRISGVPLTAARRARRSSTNGDSATLADRFDELSAQIRALTKEVNALKKARV
jgi:Zn-dependent metalloprotease